MHELFHEEIRDGIAKEVRGTRKQQYVRDSFRRQWRIVQDIERTFAETQRPWETALQNLAHAERAFERSARHTEDIQSEMTDAMLQSLDSMHADPIAARRDYEQKIAKLQERYHRSLEDQASRRRQLGETLALAEQERFAYEDSMRETLYSCQALAKQQQDLVKVSLERYCELWAQRCTMPQAVLRPMHRSVRRMSSARDVGVFEREHGTACDWTELAPTGSLKEIRSFRQRPLSTASSSSSPRGSPRLSRTSSARSERPSRTLSLDASPAAPQAPPLMRILEVESLVRKLCVPEESCERSARESDVDAISLGDDSSSGAEGDSPDDHSECGPSPMFRSGQHFPPRSTAL